MSLSIILLAPDCKNLFVYTDKREVTAGDHTFISDDCTKAIYIKPNLIFKDGGVKETSENFARVLLEKRNLSVAKLIEICEGFDRSCIMPNGTLYFDQIGLAGVDDEGELFTWAGNHNGPGGELLHPKLDCFIYRISSPTESVKLIDAFFRKQIATANTTIKDCIINTGSFAADIDKRISKTFNLLNIQI